ncbi:MinD/ParA family protein [Arthrobacter sp. OV608]|uniref:MinD/ParA family ATP-binding protein n=1 Tax=Arthrobacter sp. OV608 TaxID=1882768 RepID=UPI0008C36495|nr:MinD/ParA family protein [Arthrobacter sp. OV608]SEP86177.1 MinD-like ATPase involved in chromosome partitioning or flagellar assembly [Arthrobacter sp. OV608]
MPDPADQNARAHAEDAGQPQLRRRRDLRRADGEQWDAQTGTMPAVTPNPSVQPDGKPLTRRTSWADAAAAADAGKPAAPSRRPESAQPASPDTISSVPDPADADVSIPTLATDGSPEFRRARPTVASAIAESPMPDFISSPGLFVKEQKPRPVGGFRGALYKVTGGAWNLGPGAKQRQEDELARRISRQLQGSYNTAILSLKGGIGKTSTTVGVGLTLAEYRGDAPCAIDANPDSGDLVERALGEGIYQQASPRTITDLLKNIESIDSLTALARYMHHAGRLHLIAGEQDPEVSDSLTAAEYLRIRKLISSYYSVALTDCGTGVTHNAMSGILQSADNLVIAAGYAVSGAKRARSTLHWLASHGYEDLARNAIVVITDKDEVSSRVDKDAIEEHLSGICRELIAVPHDRGVADGDLVTLDVLKPETRRAYKEIAAAIVDGYR